MTNNTNRAAEAAQPASTEEQEFAKWFELSDEPNKCCQEAFREGYRARPAATSGDSPADARDMLIAEAVRNECLSAAHEADPQHEIRRIDLKSVIAHIDRTTAHVQLVNTSSERVENADGNEQVERAASGATASGDELPPLVSDLRFDRMFSAVVDAGGINDHGKRARELYEELCEYVETRFAAVSAATKPTADQIKDRSDAIRYRFLIEQDAATKPAAAPAVPEADALRTALKDVTDVLDMFGDLADDKMCPEAWHAARAFQKISTAREILATPATSTVGAAQTAEQVRDWRYATPSPQIAEKLELPSLPERDGDWAGDDWYTADSMRDYARDAIAASRRTAGGEPVAWARKWHVDGEMPSKVKGDNGRWSWPLRFKLNPVTPNKALRDDVPLYAAAPTLPEGWEVDFDQFAAPGTIRLHNQKWGGAFLPKPARGDIALAAIIYHLLEDVIAAQPAEVSAGQAGQVAKGCTVPPTGWYCTRVEGHEGPCAAVPEDERQCVACNGTGVFNGENCGACAVPTERPAAPAELSAEHRAVIEEAAGVLESAAAHNRAKGRTVLERTQQGRADRLREVLAATRTAEGADKRDALTAAARDVLAERRRQVDAEHRTLEEDDAMTSGQMATVAGYYALASGHPHERDLGRGTVPSYWPWTAEWWKPRDRRRNLVRAGALILAEVERLDRATNQPSAQVKP